ncbi:ATP-binding protein [uncultured Pelagimonas sp.]|uniref:ATP-binding protein n=1 Tax=uncultured Pelagimonas sp. TaxID=1618102 RepID=UPI00261F2CA8|nr:ATP-binding protein [uncultured Pelagimonas sp.]
MPAAFGRRAVRIKGFVDRGDIGCATVVIAEHFCPYDQDGNTFDPVLSGLVRSGCSGARLGPLSMPSQIRTASSNIGLMARLTELEQIDHERRMIERRIKLAKLPAVKSFDGFNVKAIPRLNKRMILTLARRDWNDSRNNVFTLGLSGTGKTHISLWLELAACPKGMPAALAKVSLLLVVELGFVPLRKTGAELLFELTSRRYERGPHLLGMAPASSPRHCDLSVLR